MNYAEAMDYIEELNKKGISPGLERVQSILGMLGNPQDALRCIHIAGTNGKGSVSAFLVSALQKSGRKVGHYQSPTLFDYRDRIQVNGEAIPEEAVASLLSRIREADSNAENVYAGSLTSFEAETIMAFLHFRNEGCEYVVLETGMGGRLDATNVITQPIVTVITAISMDHTGMLGNTLEEIAAEKAGIIKDGCPVVIGVQQPEALNVLLQHGSKHHAKIIRVMPEDIIKEKWNLDGQLISYGKWQHLRISLLGDYQPENAAVALETLALLQQKDVAVSDDMIAAGMQAAVWPGRFEVLHRNPTIIVDGAHNPAGAEKLARTLDYFTGHTIRIAMGVFRDKDYKGILRHLSGYSNTICCFAPEGRRGLEAEALADAAGAYFENVMTADSPKDAIQKLAARTMQEDIILCCGSLSIVKDVTEAVSELYGNGNAARWNRILHHPLFRQNMAELEQAERDREFCRHDLSHLLDVARIAWILALEQGLSIEKDLIYGAALLHDLGRNRQYRDNVAHSDASAELAAVILPETGYRQDEIKQILEAIRYHGELTEATGIAAGLLYEADKRSRNCFACAVADRCKWPKTQQNQNLSC